MTLWSEFDDDDLVPLPDGPLRLGDIRGNPKLEARAAAWSFLKSQARLRVREALERATHPSLSEEGRVGLLVDVAVGLGWDTFLKLQQIESKRGRSGSHARGASKQAEEDARWGVVRELLDEDPKRSCAEMTRILRHGDRKVESPPTDRERSKFERFVKRVRAEIAKNLPHSPRE